MEWEYFRENGLCLHEGIRILLRCSVDNLICFYRIILMLHFYTTSLFSPSKNLQTLGVSTGLSLSKKKEFIKHV